MDKALHREVEEKLNRRVTGSQAVTTGSINQVFRLNVEHTDDLILRRAPSRNGIGSFPSWLTPYGLRREQTAIELLGDLRSVLPATVFMNESDAADSGDWIVQTIVPGLTAADVIPGLTPEESGVVYRQIGTLTRAIHDIRGSFFGPASHGSTFASWRELLSNDCAGFHRDSEFVTGLEEEVEALLEMIHPELDGIEPVLIHSDLNLEHVFLARGDDGWYVSGLIDLEFARFADPLSEGLLHAMLTSPGTLQSNAFLDGYGEVEIDPLRLEIVSRLGRCWELTDRVRLARRLVPQMLPGQPPIF